MLIFSCQTESDLGIGILPEEDILNAELTDTLSIEVYTASSDTIVTSGTTIFLLGEYIDPIFGYSRASFVTQFETDDNPDFQDGVTYTADSAILVLGVDTAETEYYGDISVDHNFRIFQINNDLPLYLDSTYYSDHDPSLFTSGNLVADEIQRVSAYADSVVIHLSQDFADQFIIDDIYDNDTTFREAFNGFYIESECMNDNGSIIKYYSDKTYIRVYYSQAGTKDEPDYVTFESDGSYSLRFNMYEHDYSGTAFENSIDNESMQDSVAYIQSMSGVRTKIYIPHLEDLKSFGEFAIYRAELVIKTAPSEYTQDETYPVASEMTLVGYSPDEEYYLLPEYSAGSTYYGVEYEEGEYRFEIGSYITRILNDETENNGLWLFIPAGKSYFERSVITTGIHSDRIKLYIIWQKL
jgi:hypothetical protein